ncbi:chlorohydrolase family protein [Bosea sp. (in: a-proteobacteria)]|uniref:chlorohydrolase family protein n=1 Tax=Bosea sp. (in: a-proteobacteria) TaxID=1871050 RepID=UPI00273666D3|nr:chlorohydrolase family protein [Bosea sp. (in: a-proteobacteria)]MDP3408395.1 chlorohydrolase family protein [Bosea sp. (in: a-proteobacteria)]
MNSDRQPSGRSLVSGRWVVGHREGRPVLIERGEVVFENGEIVFVGHAFPGEVVRRIERPDALIAPGFIDLDAVCDLDTAVLSLDNTPSWRKGRVWPTSYIARGPSEMYSADELAFQKRYGLAQLLRNGITTALPIASLFYRQWGETYEEFAAAAEAADELGMRVYLGPAYRSGHTQVDESGAVSLFMDEARGLAGLDEAIRFCRDMEGRAGGRVRTMLAPDRIESCTPELLRRTGAAARDLDVPLRLHCHQSRFEVETVMARHGVSPTAWLTSLGLLGPHVLLPHFTDFPTIDGVSTREADLAALLAADATVVHCPVVMARNGAALDGFSALRERGLRIGLGTDTWPPDMILNMQVGLMLGRVMARSVCRPSSAEMFDAATWVGADALGRPDLGRLMPGARADLIAIDFGHDGIGQVIDPIQTLMQSSAGRDVTDVIVEGRVAMEHRVIPGFDAAAAHARAQKQFDGLIARYPERTFGHPPVAEIFQPSYPLERAP